MLFHIVRKELLDQLLSLRFAIACAICLVVFVLSSLVLTRDYREAMSTYHMNEVMHRNEMLQRTEVFSLFQGVTVDRPLNPMNVLVRGVAGRVAAEGAQVCALPVPLGLQNFPRQKNGIQ